MILNRNIRESIREIIKYEILTLKKQFAFPIKARVMKIYIGENQYYCDVLPLRNNEEEINIKYNGKEENVHIIKKVPINSLTNGPKRGIFCLPVIGSIVRIAFYDGDRSFPFVDAVLWDQTPELEKEAIAIYRDEDTYIALKQDKEIYLKTVKKVSIDAPNIYLGAEASKGIARINDEVEVYVESGSSAGTWRGKIISSSKSVFSQD